jgi:SAM-dependent methyltransferase
MDDFWSRRRTAFDAAAADYASGRPHYPADALRWCLPPDARTVIDLAAGTGIISAGLLDLDPVLSTGLEVVAVEPLAGMRALIPTGARVLEGSAEAIPLDDSVADAVLVGQAWHWFDAPRAMAEAHRVLRRGGRLCALWNLLDADDAVTRSVADIIEADERSDMAIDNPVSPFGDDEEFGPAENTVVAHRQLYDVDRVLQFARSRSQSILSDDRDRTEMLEKLRSALPNGEFTLTFVCEVWRTAAI